MGSMTQTKRGSSEQVYEIYLSMTSLFIATACVPKAIKSQTILFVSMAADDTNIWTNVVVFHEGYPKGLGKAPVQ